MKSTDSIHRLVAGTVLVFVLVLFVSMALIATTAAQEQPPANETATPAEQITPEDEFAEMTVDGTLYEWAKSPRRVYEVRDYSPDENHAVANWREAEPASAILDEELPEDIHPEAGGVI